MIVGTSQPDFFLQFSAAPAHRCISYAIPMRLAIALVLAATALSAQTVESRVVNELTGAAVAGVKLTLYPKPGSMPCSPAPTRYSPIRAAPSSQAWWTMATSRFATSSPANTRWSPSVMLPRLITFSYTGDLSNPQRIKQATRVTVRDHESTTIEVRLVY
jgi:hypothetical protein